MAPPKNPGTPRAQQNKPGDVSTPLADLCISGSSPSDFEEPPARSTRSHRTQIFRLHEWAQLEQEQQGKERQEVEEQEGKRKKEIEQIVADIMAARQRARAGHSRDGTVAVDEEHTMFNKIVQDLTKCKEKNEKQAQLARQIDTLNKDIAKKGNSTWTPLVLISFYSAVLLCLRTLCPIFCAIQLASRALLCRVHVFSIYHALCPSTIQITLEPPKSTCTSTTRDYL